MNLIHDLGYGLRQIARRPVFSLAVILTLAVGIGPNVAIFSVVRAALLRPLPFREPERLVVDGMPRLLDELALEQQCRDAVVAVLGREGQRRAAGHGAGVDVGAAAEQQREQSRVPVEGVEQVVDRKAVALLGLLFGEPLAVFLDEDLVDALGFEGADHQYANDRQKSQPGEHQSNRCKTTWFLVH